MNVIDRLYSSAVESFQGFPELGLNRTTPKEQELENSINIKLKGFIPKDKIEKITELQNELCVNYEENGFTAGFKLGIMLMAEVFCLE